MNSRNTEMNGRASRGPRRALALAALAAAAMVVAGCGGNSPPSSSGSPQYVKALAFSKCMRSHGALGFPDPSSQGTFTVTQALLNNPLIKSAAPSCRNLLPRGAVQIPAKLQRKLDDQALAYAACMRSHGVPSFPDPIIHGDSIGFAIAAQAGAGPQPSASAQAAQSSSGGSGPKSSGGSGSGLPPQMQAANRVCQHLMPQDG